MNYQVSIVDVEERGVAAAVDEAIELIGGFHPDDGSLIAIKPNLTTDKNPPESGVTTHPSVVEAVIDYINRHAQKCNIIIVETDSDGTAEEAFTRLGYRELSAKYDNVELMDLGNDELVKLIPPDSEKIRAIEIPQILISIDYLISVANLKRHVHERMTGIWKNNWGLPANRAVRSRLHPFLPEALYAFNTIFWPDLSIIDGIVGLEGAGPFEGFPKKVDKIICSHDPLAIDVVAAKLIGDKPKQIPTLKYAIKKLHRKQDDIRVVGCNPEPLNFSHVPMVSYRFYRFGLWLRRIGLYLDNLGSLAMIVGYALRIGRVSDYAGGGMQSLPSSLRMAKDLFLRPEVAERTFG